MALNHAIRRAASRVVPLAIRVSPGSQRYIHHQRSALLAAVDRPSGNILQRSLPSTFLHRYSSKPKSDASLLRVIETEIQCAADEESRDADQAEEVPQGFPFDIEDLPGQQTITLRRDYQGETITVEVHMPEFVGGEDNEEDENEEEGEVQGKQSSIPLVVRVSKKSVPSLEFGCTAFPDEISVDSLTIKDPEASEDQIAYEGPDFGDLDENLQKGFLKYLEVRGIKPSTTNFLHGYMLDKDAREYTAWLKNLQKYVQA